MDLKVQYLTLNRIDLEITCILSNYFIVFDNLCVPQFRQWRQSLNSQL